MLQSAGATVDVVPTGASAPPPVSGIDGATVVVGVVVVSSLFLPFPPPLPPLSLPPALSGLSCLSSLSTGEEEIAVTELDETSPEPRKFVDDTAAEATLQDVRNVMRSSERLGNMVALDEDWEKFVVFVLSCNFLWRIVC